MAVVSIHMPLRMVSGSVTAIQRRTTVEHIVDRELGLVGLDGSPWQVRWHRADDGRSRVRGEPTGELHVRTLCGKELDGLLETPQKREPCKLCSKAGRELRIVTIVHPAYWGETCRTYVQEQLDRYKRPERETIPYDTAQRLLDLDL